VNHDLASKFDDITLHLYEHHVPPSPSMNGSTTQTNQSKSMPVRRISREEIAELTNTDHITKKIDDVILSHATPLGHSHPHTMMNGDHSENFNGTVETFADNMPDTIESF
jgi:hypothetical protein